ncbi:hypothetical protein BVRB_5g105360 [Beta vulgaris subsp. vulgaris]|nr:hypothetical protein BVRB_5g105360 [Beta vulgaris subsp. vulgaris]
MEDQVISSNSLVGEQLNLVVEEEEEEFRSCYGEESEWKERDEAVKEESCDEESTVKMYIKGISRCGFGESCKYIGQKYSCLLLSSKGTIISSIIAKFVDTILTLIGYYYET